MTDDEQDQLLNDATHAVGDEFREHGIELQTDDLYAINDFLTSLLAAIAVKRRMIAQTPG